MVKCSQRQRIQMVLLRESGMAQPAIAAAMGVSLSTVNRAHMAYDHGGIKARKPKPNGGRKHENMTLAEEKALLARFSEPTGAGNHVARRRQRSTQGWKTFLRNHADGIVTMDTCVAPTISYRLLYGFLLSRHSRRHGNRRNYISFAIGGDVVIQRLRAMGVRDRPISPRSPWQNGYSERLIGSIRRDCLDRVVVFGERHLRHLLNSYQKNIYNEARTHLSLHKDAPILRTIQTVGRTLAMPVLGGLHH